MHFGYATKVTKPYWNKHQAELMDMIDQLGTPTLFFTLSVIDTKWLDLHQLFANYLPIKMQSSKKRLENVVNNPHAPQHYTCINDS